MAIRYDPRLYTAGTAVFNPEPITRASEYVARYKQAKNEALDQYYQKRADSINSAGMRNQDLPDFNDKITQLKDYYLVNKDKLRKGDVMAQSNYEKLFRDTMGVVQRSKGRTETGNKLFEIAQKQREEGGAPTDELMQAIHMNDLPVSHPESKDVDPNYFIAQPKPFDLSKHLKQYEDIPRTPGKPEISPTDINTGKRIIKETETFDDNAKNTIAFRAGNSYQNDRSFQREVNKSIADPATKKQLADIYESQYNKPPEQNEDYAAAYILGQKQLVKTNQKLEDDKEWAAAKRQQERIQLQGMREKAAIGLQAMRARNAKDLAEYRNKLKGASKEEQVNVLDTTFQSIEDDAKKNGKYYHTKNGEKVGEFYMANVPDAIKGELGRKNEKGKLEYPHHIAFNPDGTVQIIYYKTDDNGNPIKSSTGASPIDNTKTHTITKDQFKALIGKKLFGTKTTSGADYGDDTFDETSEEDGGGEITPSMPVPKPDAKSTKKKIPGF